MKHSFISMRATLLVALAAATLSACGGGAPTEENPNTTPPNQPTYNGPAPATAEVQAFRLALWDNVKSTGRCGGCHIEGEQSPMFARQDDINLAFEAANTVVNLSDPAASRMVTKVAGGHNCWLASAEACADLLTTWIRNWAGSAASGGTQIQLVAPPDRDVGDSREFPDVAAYQATIWPLVTGVGGCVRCHSPASQTPQAPFFANPDVAAIEEAYSAARTKISLEDDNSVTDLADAKSRLVVRLRDEFHNCWSGNCAADAATMFAAVKAFVEEGDVIEVDPSLTLSKAVTLYDGVVASGGNRFEANTIAKWEFKTGQSCGESIAGACGTAFDTSGVDPAIDLTLSGNVAWVGGWGINVRAGEGAMPGGKVQGSTASSRKLRDLIGNTGEYSVELWIAPANVAQEDAFIATYSGGVDSRNFTVAQQQYQVEFLHRSSTTNANGSPSLITDADDEDLQATLQHVVVTFDPTNGRRIYINGEDTGDRDPDGAAAIGDWDDTFAFVLGNEVSGSRQFTGVYRFVAVHNRALTQAQIQQNFEVGVGERYFLLFGISHLIDVPQSYVMFEVSQFDSYGYLFNKPAFISLDADARPGSIVLQGMRIGENGAELHVGQAYRTLDTTITDSDYTPGVGAPLSQVGTVVALQKGPLDDLFFLCFDRLGARENVCSEDASPTPIAPTPVAKPALIGVRTFDEINATMAAVTGVSPNDADVRATYSNIRQSLPAVNDIQAFLGSHQTAVAQLAIQYCNALVEDTSARASYFPGLDWNSTLATQQDRDRIIDPIIDRVTASTATEPLDNQPDRALVHDELNDLIQGRLCQTTACGPGRTPTVVKATCAAALSSAAMIVK
jgi:hypothetical protein